MMPTQQGNLNQLNSIPVNAPNQMNSIQSYSTLPAQTYTSVRAPLTTLQNETKLSSSMHKRIDGGLREMLICQCCGYTTQHSGHFKVHCSQGCESILAEKDMNCPICCELFTYNNLRYHLRQYLNDTSKAQHGHQHFSPKVHRDYLEKIKKEKKEEKQRQRNENSKGRHQF